MYKFTLFNYTFVVFFILLFVIDSLQREMTSLGRIQKSLLNHNLHTTHNSELECKEDYVKCVNDSRCIPKFLWCNGKVDCADGSDEEMCSCLDQIDNNKICDGRFDCFDGDDELNCFGCGNNSFSCLDWTRRDPKGMCVSLSRRCDGVTQCPNKKDELDCSILTPSPINHDTVINYKYKDGYFFKNWKGNWYPVCPETQTWASDACLEGTGSLASEPPTITVNMNMKKEKRNLGQYIAMMPWGQVKLLNDCFAEIAFVLCTNQKKI
ncbi:atrial natriuretic peptide-converting enzyme-like [Cotesia glomerata]|nr:atrial natriuretic peptide-converting enzyme-like [Cotesia glomerata]